ncbi:hypothetical protein GB937_005119 [Aspergillus fischeri]|nr:hypothetical protein GB937_005119 [Aspergillus fischeri]
MAAKSVSKGKKVAGVRSRTDSRGKEAVGSNQLSIIKDSGPAYQGPSQHPTVRDESPISVVRDNCLRTSSRSGRAISRRVCFSASSAYEKGTGRKTKAGESMDNWAVWYNQPFSSTAYKDAHYVDVADSPG